MKKITPIPFNRPPLTGKELKYLKQALENRHLAGDGQFTHLCHDWLEKNTGCKKALLTTSCTQALEMSAILADIEPGDEVIMSSYTFVSTANAFVLRGARIVFVDIRPDTMNIDEKLIENAITERTRAIVPMHYAGVSCEMDTIMDMARKHNLAVIEDAAQGIMCSYRGKAVGACGHFGCYSFHGTKNIVCGEGGAVLINDELCAERADIVRQKGTDRSKFLLGQVDKYTWQDIGSSYLPSELNAAFLLAQLESAEKIMKDRIASWNYYFAQLLPLKDKGLLELPHIPEDCKHNGHIFYIKLGDKSVLRKVIEFLRKDGIQAVSHYVPLHSSKAGIRFGRLSGNDIWTTRESSRLLRLPMYYGLKREEIERVVSGLSKYFTGRN